MDAFFRLLPGIFESMDASEEVRTAFVFAAWRRVAGGHIVERTEPVELVNRHLVIAVADITWKRNLETLAAQLVFKLNSTLGRSTVDRIDFRIVPDKINSRTGVDKNDEVDKAVEFPTELVNSAASIRDEKLRAAVLGAAVNCLSRRA